MAINTYARLKQSIINWSHRTDISDYVDDVIHLAESEIDKHLLSRHSEQTATATLSTSSRYLALPTRFLKMRRMTLVSGSKKYELKYQAPEQMTVKEESGMPTIYTITSQFEFNKTPDSAYDVEQNYFTTINPLSASNTTNPILTAYPDLYLYGCLIQVAMIEKDFDMVQMYQAKFDRTMLDANKEDRKGRYGPAPAIMKEGSTP
jgi:hypothetical protein